MRYPPVWNLLVVLCESKAEQSADIGAGRLAEEICQMQDLQKKVFPVGPTSPAIGRVNDIYRRVVYVKAEDYKDLVCVKDRLEHYVRDNADYKDVTVQFDFNPVNGF